MRLLIILLMTLALAFGCGSNDPIESTHGEFTITLTQPTYSPGDTVRFTVTNDRATGVFVDPCPGLRIQKLAASDWVQVWQQESNCEVMFVEPREMKAGTSFLFENGPVLVESATYRVAIRIWEGPVADPVQQVYSQPFQIK